MKKRWKAINGWPYEISDHGYVRRVTASSGTYIGKVLKLVPVKRGGYFQVTLSRKGNTKNFLVHNLVARAFIGSRPTHRHEVAHWDGDHHNNSWKNLRWATRKENCADMIRHKRTTRKCWKGKSP